MHGATLDDAAHEDDEPDATHQTRPPVLCRPLAHTLQRFTIQEHVFQPRQRSFRVDRSTFEEYITVALKIITRRARSQTDAAWRESNTCGELTRRSTRVDLRSVHARQLAQLPLVRVGL